MGGKYSKQRGEQFQILLAEMCICVQEEATMFVSDVSNWSVVGEAVWGGHRLRL